MSQMLHGLYLHKKFFIVILNFKYNWASCVLFAKPGNTWRVHIYIKVFILFTLDVFYPFMEWSTVSIYVTLYL